MAGLRRRAKGRRAVRIFTPVASLRHAESPPRDSLVRWALTLAANRAQGWRRVQNLLALLLAADAKKVLYRLYAERLASLSLQPADPDWDGATQFESK